MKTKLVFWTAFNSYQSPKLLRRKPVGAQHPVTTEAWTTRRVDLFTKYNLPSILNQAHDDFLYVVLMDPKLRHLTDNLMPTGDCRVMYVHEDEWALDMLKHYDEIVLALIDSDDMYASRAGACMMACPAKWMYFKHGYAYEERRGRLWAYDTIHTGPFFARRIDPKTMTRFDRDKRNPTHVAVQDYKPTQLAKNQFCVLLHERNTSSTPQMRYVKHRPVDKAILTKEFGLPQ